MKTAISIGAGPAGLTAAYELCTRTDIHPIVLEKSHAMGGLARTVNYKGNRIDMGGHRFFSKSDRVMEWWLQMLPLEDLSGSAPTISYHGMRRDVPDSRAASCPTAADRVMLLRSRQSRIYYLGRLFEYPITLSPDTLLNLGLWRTCKIVVSYLRSSLFPIKPEETLEHFLTNRFGRELYLTFFKSYTEKVWGMPCNRISAEWGKQRIKAVSIWSALLHALKKSFQRGSHDFRQKETQTSLIDQFLYPKFGPGQMWEEVARRIREAGGRIHTGYRAEQIVPDGYHVQALEAIGPTGKTELF